MDGIPTTVPDAREGKPFAEPAAYAGQSPLVGHIDVNGVSFGLPDGRPLLRDVHLRVGEGAKVALIGPNGTGKTTLTRIIAGDLAPDEGAVTRSGGLAVMRQFIGKVRDDSTVRDLLLSVAPDSVRLAACAIDAAELRMMERDSEADQMAYAQALSDWADVGGYDWETHADVCTVAALGMPFEKAQWRKVATLSGGEQKRVVLESLLRGPEEELLPGRARQLPGRPGQTLAGGPAGRQPEDRPVHQSRPRTPGPGRDPDRHLGADRWRQRDLGASGALRDL